MRVSSKIILHSIGCLSLCLLLIGCEQAQQPTHQSEQTSLSPSSVSPASFLAGVKNGDESAVQAALAGGIDPNTQDAEGFPALLRATMSRRPAIVKALLEKGADPDLVEAKEAGHSPHFTSLIIAASLGDNATLTTLLDHGADVTYGT